MRQPNSIMRFYSFQSFKRYNCSIINPSCQPTVDWAPLLRTTFLCWMWPLFWCWQNGNLTLSPLPTHRAVPKSPRRRVSDTHSVFIRPLTSSETHAFPPSPTCPLSYCFSRSPAKVGCLVLCIPSHVSCVESIKSYQDRANPSKAKVHLIWRQELGWKKPMYD